MMKPRLEPPAIEMRYYPVVRNWSRKIKPHLSDPEVQTVLVRDFNRFTFGRWEKPFVAGMKPTDFESCDWRYERRGRQPEFWDFENTPDVTGPLIFCFA